MNTASRIYTDAFDYNSRRKRTNLLNSSDAARSLVARLRLDALLFGKIVITDVQLIHSLFLSHLVTIRTDDGGTIGQELPLDSVIVRTRKKGLASTLVSLVRPNGLESPPGHLFTLLDPTGELIPELQKESVVKEVKEWRDVPRLLKKLKSGQDSTLIEQSEEAWAFWIEAEEAGRLATEVQTSRFTINDVLSRWQADAGIPKCATEFGAELLSQVCSGSMHRGALAAKLLAQDRYQTLNDREMLDLETIDTSFGAVYNQLVAETNMCTYSDTNSPAYLYSVLRDGSPIYDDRGNTNDDELHKLERATRIPYSFLVRLSAMPSEAYRHLVAYNSKQMSAWRTRGNQESLKKAMEDLQVWVEKYGPSDDAKDNPELGRLIPWRRLIKPNVAAAAAVAGQAIAAASGVPWLVTFVGTLFSNAASTEVDRRGSSVDSAASRSQVASLVQYAKDRKAQASLVGSHPIK